MSYCRFGPDADVYVWSDGASEYHCGCCPLLGDFIAHDVHGIMAHLDLHVAAGHRVPAGVFEALREEFATVKG